MAWGHSKFHEFLMGPCILPIGAHHPTVFDLEYATSAFQMLPCCSVRAAALQVVWCVTWEACDCPDTCDSVVNEGPHVSKVYLKYQAR
jgi:hypothetical protein